jgi:hypothetical protein
MGETAFPLEQFAPELPLERLDCPGKGRLRNDAFLRCSGEVQCAGCGEKVADLMHFHRIT